jgi:hypothetical protein
LGRCNGGGDVDKARLGQFFRIWENYCMDNILGVKTAEWRRMHLLVAVEGRSRSRNKVKN